PDLVQTLRLTAARLPGGGVASPELMLRALLLLNVVFALENGIDSVFLWGRVDLPLGLTYASYAHRGAYPLVAAALLVAAIVLVPSRRAGAVGGGRGARRLAYLWLAQTVALTGSAFQRLRLYVGVYGLTRLRLAAALWMLLIAFGLGAILVRLGLRRSNG